MIEVERLAEVLVEVADTLIDDFDVVEFLETVTTHSVELSGARAAGLVLADMHGRLQFMAASRESVRLLELFQLQSHEGPCLECYNSGVPVVNTDLTTARTRWPQFAPRAVRAGFRSVHAFPLRCREAVIGALNLFSTEIGELEAADARVIQALADISTIGLLQHRAIRDRELLTEQLQGALNTRITIEQAKGVLARTYGVHVDDAFDLMRNFARRNHHRLGEVAEAVVTDPGRYPDLTVAGTDPR